ncbi:glycoside hydrolase family 31 protein [Athelia psychrophila]|uniref:Glycoside hydrolase family 31 protein n=1 Tax=Athelia psychrophila TaxID=1759441 RepID=A0A166S9A6_9AGAM|nr:glycoside hydrolase family 31 protein [Fibularhizoctonia sp. CBS 109695]
MHRLNGTATSTHTVLMLSIIGMDATLRDGVLQYRINGGLCCADLVANFGRDAPGQHPPRDAVGRHRYPRPLRDFTVSNSSHRGIVGFINSLHQNNEHFISILDAAVPVTTNASDVYAPYTDGTVLGMFLKNPGGDNYIAIDADDPHKVTGSATCGFNGSSDEELCNRWMQAAAFIPSSATITPSALSGAIGPASRIAIGTRYTCVSSISLELHLTSLATACFPSFTHAIGDGVAGRHTSTCSLFYEFRAQSELFGVDQQWLIGDSVLATLVMEVNTSTVQDYFSGTDGWRSWFTHVALNSTSNLVTIQAPLSAIHPLRRKRSTAALYTALHDRGNQNQALRTPCTSATGSAIIQDGISLLTSSAHIASTANKGSVSGTVSISGHTSEQPLSSITVLGVSAQPSAVNVGGKAATGFTYESGLQRLNVTGLAIALHESRQVTWVLQ